MMDGDIVTPRSTELQRVRDFAARVFRRCDGTDEVVPAGFEPAWADAPARFRTYRGRPHIALPEPLRLQRHFDACRRARAAAPEAPPTLAEVALLLQLSLAPLRRKVDLTWNAPEAAIGFEKQDFGRGSASGGGLYPTQAYLVSDGAAPGAGVYHYSPAQHALVPIRHGRFARRLADAIGGADGEHAHPYYLVLAPDVWMNAMKYHNFGLHVCSQDVGALLATLRLAGDSLGMAQRACVVFDDAAVNRVTGADGDHESAFAVVGLGAPRRRPAAGPAPIAPVPLAWQKSRQVRLAPEWQAIHRLMLLDDVGVQAALAADDAPTRPATPVDATLQAHLPGVLQARRSAWGSLHGPSPIGRATLVDWLGFVWRQASGAHSPLRERLPESALTLYVRTQHVDGMAAGNHRFVPDAETPFAEVPGVALPSWQSSYAMHNYNIDEAGALLFVVVDIDAVLDRWGARGYRVLNAHVGVLAQLGYVGAAARGLDGGAVLGVRAQQVKRSLGLAPTQEVCIAMYLSQAQPAVRLFDYSLIPDVPTWTTAS